MPLCTAASAITESCYFTTADATSAWPGLPRLTGLSGIPSTQTTRQVGNPVTTIITVTANATDGNISPGTLAGSVIGGVIFGALICFATVFAIHYRKKRQAQRDSLAQPYTQPNPNTDVAHNPATAPLGFNTISRRELEADRTGWVELAADRTNRAELENHQK